MGILNSCLTEDHIHNNVKVTVSMNLKFNFHIVFI